MFLPVQTGESALKPPFTVCQLLCIIMPSLHGEPIVSRDEFSHAQITALLFLPDFPGWLAPLHFNPGIMLPSPMMYAQNVQGVDIQQRALCESS